MGQTTMWLFLTFSSSLLPLFCCWTSAFHHVPLYRSLNFSSGPHHFQLAESRRHPLDATENKVEKLGQFFKRNVRKLREKSGLLDLVFLVDESSSVGYANFVNELKFVKKLLSDFPVVPSATRVAIVTFSSKNNVHSRVDYISSSQAHQHKCSLLNKEIPAITYKGGGTYTKGAFQQAAQILRHSRGNSTKVIFLITDGYSNGGDPRPVAMMLRDLGVEIFTFGIWQGNIRELHDMASHPKEEHCYLLYNFAEFEALARRALHEDLPSGSYIQEAASHCSYLCEAGEDCCDEMASCKCGTHTGQFECICEKGYYGKGLKHECTDHTKIPSISQQQSEDITLQQIHQKMDDLMQNIMDLKNFVGNYVKPPTPHHCPTCTCPPSPYPTQLTPNPVYGPKRFDEISFSSSPDPSYLEIPNSPVFI